MYDLTVLSELAPSSTKAFRLNLTSVAKDNSTAATDAAAKGTEQQQQQSATQTLAATRYATSNGRSWDSIVLEVKNFG